MWITDYCSAMSICFVFTSHILYLHLEYEIITNQLTLLTFYFYHYHLSSLNPITCSKHIYNTQKLEPWEVGFHSTGGFLAPAFAGDAVATWSPQPHSGEAYWLDDVQIRELEPSLHPNVIGGWWFPEDASVDARRLTCSLRASCEGKGVHILTGKGYEVTSLEMSRGKCTGVHTANGNTYSANAIVVANGSWMKNLLPVPIVPHKGQSLSLRMPSDTPPILNRVLFAQDTYVVPKADGRIIIGATVEPGRFDGDVTPEGMLHCLHEATRLCPSLKELPIEETWAGLRPTTPDKCPILGNTLFDNVYIAGGYWRNGVLLAPKTGQLVGDLILNDGDPSKMSDEDAALLKAFAWDRFTQEGGGAKLAANARHASSLYPVHKRSSLGVSSSVGTELGFYEGASAAKGDREADRNSMFGLSEEVEERLEKAAKMGVSDAGAFDFSRVDKSSWIENDGDDDEAWGGKDDVSDKSEDREGTTVTAADPDAFTIGVVEDKVQSESESHNEAEIESTVVDSSNLSSIYEKIKANKAKAAESIEMGQDTTEKKPDLPFRIYHVDKKTREVTMVPPRTQPGIFLKMKAEGKLKPTNEIEAPKGETDESDSDASVSVSKPSNEESKSTYDGYSAIREAFGECSTEEETAAATRAARMRNRVKSSQIDESKIGAMSIESPSNIKRTEDAVSGTVSKEQSDESTAVVNQVISNVQSAGGSFSTANDTPDESNETTFDGYTDIQNANGSDSRDEELDKMRAMRMKNRIKSSDLDELFQP